MSRGTYLRSTVSFWASSSQLWRRVLNSDAPCLSALAATGGNALINTDCPSLTAGRSVSLMILGAPALPLLPKDPDWLMSGSQWYFHIDTSIDDSASGTSHIDQLESDTFQTVWRMYLCIMRVIYTCLWKCRTSIVCKYNLLYEPMHQLVNQCFMPAMRTNCYLLSAHTINVDMITIKTI